MAHQTFFKHEQPTRVDLKRAAKADAEQHQRQVVREVNQRDGYACRCCGRLCDPNAPDLLRKGHHHHIVFRSAGGEDATANECLLCAACHADVHAGKLHIEGNADERLTFMRRGVDGAWYVARQELAVRVVEKD